MRQREYHACLVHFLVAVAAQLVHLPGVCHNQKAGEVVFVGFDTFLQHLHAVTFGGGFGTNGGMSSQVFFPDDFRTESGVLAFHYLDAGMLFEELTALHQGDGVGVYFRDVVPILVGQANKAMRDAQFVFAYNLCAALAQDRKIFKRRKYFHIRICEAQRVIPGQNVLETSIGSIEYDYLVIATGCYTNYFGNNEMALQTMSLKTTAEALANRNQVLESFEKAQNTSDMDERKKLMTFLIVGGGATGIELSGALAEMRNFILPQDYPDLDIKHMRIVLIDAAPRYY